MPRTTFPVIVSTALLSLHLTQACAQQPKPYASGHVQLVLTCAASQCRFRQGELIPVDLTFRAIALGYEVMTTQTRRFEMGEKDTFRAEPAEGVIDPVGDAASHWLEAGSWAVAVGGDILDPLSGHPAVKLRLELNQWLYFEKPGIYKVTGISRRLCENNRKCGEMTSNSINVEIVPADPEWQRQELDRIVRDLPATLAKLTTPEKAAVRALTHLGTDEALAIIKKRLAADGTLIDLEWRLAEVFLHRKTTRETAR